MKPSDFKDRIDALIQLAAKTLKTKYLNDNDREEYVDEELFEQVRVGGLSFLSTVFGSGHVFYECFNEKVVDNDIFSAKQAKGILNAAKTEIDGGWLFTVRGIVSAEIFNDFLEMANHLLSEGYKDPAAVMIGSALEEHLRFLCKKNGISVTPAHPKTGKPIPVKADVMNAELVKANVYNQLDQKQVTAWLGLRNSAAHGKYSDYNKEQVEMMEQGVLSFMTRIS